MLSVLLILDEETWVFSSLICYMLYFLLPNNFKLVLQIGDLKGFFGLLMVNLVMLRTKLKVLDFTYGNSTGGLHSFLSTVSGSLYFFFSLYRVYNRFITDYVSEIHNYFIHLLH